jgi:hypothetical protein
MVKVGAPKPIAVVLTRELLSCHDVFSAHSFRKCTPLSGKNFGGIVKRKWDVDDATVVELEIGGFGKSVVTVNGAEIPSELSARKKGELQFELSGGRHAVLSIKPQFGSSPLILLRIGGQLMIATEKAPVKCGACGAVVKPNDRFCEACGHAMPPAEHYVHRKYVQDATQAIWMLAGLFVLSGVIMFFVAKSQADAVLQKLSGLDPAMQFPKPISGVVYTVAALRDKIAAEPWDTLAVNLILAVVMAGLAFWGRRAPLAAVLVAAATYAVVIVTNTIIDPATIGQGIYVKMIVILLLFRGAQGALALRAANA